MKKLFLLLLSVGMLSSCVFNDLFKYSAEIEDGTDPNFDEYPGMNINDDPLEGELFELPEDVYITMIFGEQNQREEEDQDEELKITGDMYGSGLCVIVTLEITNDNSKDISLRLPAGLMVQSASSSYQNGILVKDVIIPVKANKTRSVSVRFYCLNVDAHGSDSGSEYALAYITNVKAFEPLFNVCAGKKVNIDEYKTSGILKYYSTSILVQEIVWAITRGKTFTEAEIQKYMKHVKKSK